GGGARRAQRLHQPHLVPAQLREQRQDRRLALGPLRGQRLRDARLDVAVGVEEAGGGGGDALGTEGGQALQRGPAHARALVGGGQRGPADGGAGAGEEREDLGGGGPGGGAQALERDQRADRLLLLGELVEDRIERAAAAVAHLVAGGERVLRVGGEGDLAERL